MANVPLYRRVLADRFTALPDVLRQFHEQSGSGRVRGTLRVTRGQSVLSRLAAAMLRLPRSGEHVPVVLQVYVDDQRERWKRWFGDQVVETIQWERDGFLFERFGPMVLVSDLEVDGDCLHYRFRRASLFGIPLPHSLAPNVVGTVQVSDGGWNVITDVSLPLTGRIIRYEGRVVPE